VYCGEGAFRELFRHDSPREMNYCDEHTISKVIKKLRAGARCGPSHGTGKICAPFCLRWKGGFKVRARAGACRRACQFHTAIGISSDKHPHTSHW
jgi:hypothetical protein